MLWFPMSKIQSESNSQRRFCTWPTRQRCGFLCQRYNLKAIHNCLLRLLKIATAVVSYVKDTIWKQFTTFSVSPCWWGLLWFPMSKIQSESNSQPWSWEADKRQAVVSYVKDTIWKQFTTRASNCFWYDSLWFPMSKIQSESNSQPVVRGRFRRIRCGFLCQRYNLKAIHNQPVILTWWETAVVSYVKDTIWKQFTTLLL